MWKEMSPSDWMRRKSNCEAMKSIKTRIILLTLLCTVLVGTVSSVFLYCYISQSQMDAYRETAQQLLKKDANNVNDYLRELQSLCQATFLDSSLSSYIQFERNTLTAQRYTEGLLRQLCLGHKEIELIYLYIPKMQLLYTVPRVSLSLVRADPEAETADWYQRGMENKNLTTLLPVGKWNFYPPGVKNLQTTEFFTMTRTMRNASGTECQAMLSLQVNPDRLISLLSIPEESREAVAIVDADGKTFYTSEPMKMETVCGDQTLRMNGIQYLVLQEKTYGDMSLYKAIPLDTFSQAARRSVTAYIPLLMACMLLLTLTLIAVMEQSVIRPLQKMADVMVGAKGTQHFPRLAANRGDEIGLLARTYNEMSENIEQLINADYTNRLMVKNAQVAALRAQVNPHFMNNLLQSIGTLALENGNMDVYTAITMLSELMHYTYRGDLKTVPLDTELEYMERYIAVQKIRFGDALRYRTEIEPALMSVPVPNMILQPLIENAINYGFRAGVRELNICLRAFRRDGWLHLLVTDDGRGMQPEQLEKIREELSQTRNIDSFGEHIGLKNVYLRLYLTFGEQMNMSVESRLMEGTQVEMSFAVMEWKEEAECIPH